MSARSSSVNSCRSQSSQSFVAVPMTALEKLRERKEGELVKALQKGMREE